jgi:hypothetical protein
MPIVPTLKTILASAALLLALEQVWSMAEVRGWIEPAHFRPRLLVRIHRWGGLIAWLLVTAIIGIGLTLVFVIGYSLHSPRLWLHVGFGVLAWVVLLTKVLMSNRHRRLIRHSLALGVGAGVFITGAFLFSAVWYFVIGP